MKWDWIKSFEGIKNSKKIEFGDEKSFVIRKFIDFFVVLREKVSKLVKLIFFS